MEYCFENFLMEKLVALPIIGHHAFVSFAKNTMPVFGDNLINCIAKESWKHDAYIQPIDGCGQLPEDSKSSRRMGIYFIPFQQYQGINLDISQAKVLQNLLPSLRLQGSKHEAAVFIMFDDKIHHSVAIIAHPIEKNDRFFH